MKKNTICIAAFLVLTIIGFASCEQESEDNQEDIVDKIMPINTGNTWKYKVSSFDWNREYIDTTETIIGDAVTINGFSGYVFSDERPNHAVFFGGNDENGNFLSYGGYSDIDTLTVSSIFFKKNAFIGEEWNYIDVNLNWDTGLFEELTVPVKCIAVDTTITTPLGSYSCMTFQLSRNQDVYRYYVSVNIGIIKIEYYEGVTLFSTNELIDYNLVDEHN